MYTSTTFAGSSTASSRAPPPRTAGYSSCVASCAAICCSIRSARLVPCPSSCVEVPFRSSVGSSPEGMNLLKRSRSLGSTSCCTFPISYRQLKCRTNIVTHRFLDPLTIFIRPYFAIVFEEILLWLILLFNS